MKFCSVICCLFINANFVFFGKCQEFNEKDITSGFDGKLYKGDRWRHEIKSFRRGLKIMNDKGELVELTTADKPPPGLNRRQLGQKILFHLYTIQNPTDPDVLTINTAFSNIDLQKSHFDRQKPTIFITHGWLNNGRSPSCAVILEAYLNHTDANVIVVDWNEMSISAYGWAVKNVEYVGKRVADMIKFLIKNAGLNPNTTTLIGHSLGAHVMGIAGFNTDGIVATIIGLDPAYPMFSLADPGSRISILDGKYVEIIHTNAGFLGYDHAIGNVDFYPDGGTRQKNCPLDLGGSCSHARSFEYYAESIGSKIGFYGKRCRSRTHFMFDECTGPNVAKMGGLTIDPRVRGTYYLWTGNERPYALGIGA